MCVPQIYLALKSKPESPFWGLEKLEQRAEHLPYTWLTQIWSPALCIDPQIPSEMTPECRASLGVAPKQIKNIAILSCKELSGPHHQILISFQTAADVHVSWTGRPAHSISLSIQSFPQNMRCLITMELLKQVPLTRAKIGIFCEALGMLRPLPRFQCGLGCSLYSFTSFSDSNVYY